MSDDEDVRRMRPAPSTNVDGLDLTVSEARAMSPEVFRSVFGLSSLDDVPVVAPGIQGCFDRAPTDCDWYVRLRAKPKNPGPKDRKHDTFELVVKRPKEKRDSAAGSGSGPRPSDPSSSSAHTARRDENPPDSGGKPMRIALQGKDADAARLDALVYLARKAGRKRRATSWPIERIQSLRCWDVIERYIQDHLENPPEGKVESHTERATRVTLRSKARAFQKAFAELEIGDIDNTIAQKYDARASHRSSTTRPADLHMGRKALKEGLLLMTVPPTYSLHFKVPDAKPLDKETWTPAEYDRVRAAAAGCIHNPDGTVRGHRSRRSIDQRAAWRRAIEFLPYTLSRNGRLPPTRWVPPDAEPADGLPLDDRPWIEVGETEVVYHRGGEARYDGKKRRGTLIIPEEFAPTVRQWFAEDAAKGREFVFHKPDGKRYQGRHLVRKTFASIVKDAAVPAHRVPHHFKDLGVDWADEADMDREDTATLADTTPRTLTRKYGDRQRRAKLRKAAKALNQGEWRERGSRKSQVKDLFEKGRGGTREPPPASGRRRSPRAA